MGVGQGDRVACVATIDLSKTPAPVELKSQVIDDLALLPEPGAEKPARRRRAGASSDGAPNASKPTAPTTAKNAKASDAPEASKPAAPRNAKPDNGANGRARPKK
jgi:hypothetical protein